MPSFFPDNSAGMIQKLITVAAWACFIFIVFATLSSIALRPELASDETDLIVFIERFGAYALLGIVFRIAYPNRITFVCLLVLGSAVVLELLQIVVPSRDARVLDALEKMAGGVMGIAAADIIRSHTKLGR
jgi:VanZ family protein